MVVSFHIESRMIFVKTSLPPWGSEKGGTYQKYKLQYPVFFGGEGDLQKCNLHFWRFLFMGGGGVENISWIYLTYRINWPL